MQFDTHPWVESFFQHMQHEKRHSVHTLSSYRIDLRQFAAFLSTQLHIDDLAAVAHTAVRSWVVSLMEQGITPRSINRKIACLRSFYRFGLKQGFATANPTEKIRALKTAQLLPQFVLEEDAQTLLDRGDPTEDSFEAWRDRLVIELLYDTGMRKAELIDLKLQSINIRQCMLRVRGKRRKERIIPFPQSLIPTLEHYLAHRAHSVEKRDNDYLLVTAEGNPLYPMIVYRIVRKHLLAFPYLEKKGSHVFRHTYATHLLNRGASINAVKDLLGHSSLAATQVYTHNSIEKLKQVFDQAHPKA